MTMLGALAARQAARPEGYLDAPASRRIAARAEALAPDPSDPALERLSPALERAESALRARDAGPWWQNDGGVAARAWHDVEAAAAEAATSLRRRRGEVLGAWPAAERVAVEGLEAARGVLSAPGSDRHQRAAAAARAAVELQRARGLAAQGRLDEALAAAERSRYDSGQVRDGWAAAHSRFGDPAELSLWRSLVEAAFHDAGRRGTHLIVDKLARRLDVYAGSRPIAEFAVELGSNGLARKAYAGDRATPEGRYKVVQRRGPGQTRYHRALMLDYPNAGDRKRWEAAQRAGEVPSGAGPGGLIEIHGDGGRGVDWTDGCVALTNAEMDRLFELVPMGASVTIVGTYERPSADR
jgi:L,D-transpeptidase catalytic domain